MDSVASEAKASTNGEGDGSGVISPDLRNVLAGFSVTGAGFNVAGAGMSVDEADFLLEVLGFGVAIWISPFTDSKRGSFLSDIVYSNQVAGIKASFL